MTDYTQERFSIFKDSDDEVEPSWTIQDRFLKIFNFNYIWEVSFAMLGDLFSGSKV